LAGADLEDWQDALSANQRSSLQKELVKLKKKSKKEVAIAGQDGPKAQDFFRKEYARKIRDLLARYRREAAKATKAESSGASHSQQEAAGDADDVSATAPPDSKQKPAGHNDESEPAAAGSDQKAGGDADDSSDAAPGPILLLAGADLEDWQDALSANQRSSLQKELVKLKKKSKKEVAIAGQDGPKAQDFFRKEYARKIRDLLARYRREAAKATKAESSGASHSQQEAAGDADDVSATAPPDSKQKPVGHSDESESAASHSQQEATTATASGAHVATSPSGSSGQEPSADGASVGAHGDGPVDAGTVKGIATMSAPGTNADFGMLAAFAVVFSAAAVLGFAVHAFSAPLGFQRRRAEVALLADPAPV